MECWHSKFQSLEMSHSRLWGIWTDWKISNSFLFGLSRRGSQACFCNGKILPLHCTILTNVSNTFYRHDNIGVEKSQRKGHRLVNKDSGLERIRCILLFSFTFVQHCILDSLICLESFKWYWVDNKFPF